MKPQPDVGKTFDFAGRTYVAVKVQGPNMCSGCAFVGYAYPCSELPVECQGIIYKDVLEEVAKALTGSER